MSKDLIARYIWIVDTLRRYSKLTRDDINKLWLRSPLSGGAPLPERTFFHYRRAIEENFHIEINCTAAGEYFIDEATTSNIQSLSNWLVDSYAVSNTLMESGDIAERVEVEDVPSARLFLPVVLGAMRNNEKVTFSYQSFSRSRPDTGILFCPYLLKRYKQRWYMYGRREPKGELRTYALDRVKNLRVEKETFDMPGGVSPEEVFGPVVGVTSSKAEQKEVRLYASRTQAKYLRALPLHKSQIEMVHDRYSIFTYRLKLNYELVSEIMALGPEVKVLAPPELRAMVVTRLRETLRQYDDTGQCDDNGQYDDPGQDSNKTLKP